MGDMIDKDAVLAILNDHVQVGSMIEAITALPAVKLADAVELPEIKALVGTATKTLTMVEDLVAESGRAIKYDAEDAFRMGEWFDDADMQDITKAHAALAALQTKGGA
jgi:hypothetical protein